VVDDACCVNHPRASDHLHQIQPLGRIYFRIVHEKNGSLRPRFVYIFQQQRKRLPFHVGAVDLDWRWIATRFQQVDNHIAPVGSAGFYNPLRAIQDGHVRRVVRLFKRRDAIETNHQPDASGNDHRTRNKHHYPLVHRKLRLTCRVLLGFRLFNDLTVKEVDRPFSMLGKACVVRDHADGRAFTMELLQ